jgi:hypothetical protein
MPSILPHGGLGGHWQYDAGLHTLPSVPSLSGAQQPLGPQAAELSQSRAQVPPFIGEQDNTRQQSSVNTQACPGRPHVAEQ